MGNIFNEYGEHSCATNDTLNTIGENLIFVDNDGQVAMSVDCNAFVFDISFCLYCGEKLVAPKGVKFKKRPAIKESDLVFEFIDIERR